MSTNEELLAKGRNTIEIMGQLATKGRENKETEKVEKTHKSCNQLCEEGWRFNNIPIYDVDDDIIDMLPWLGETEEHWHNNAKYSFATYGHESGRLAKICFYNLFYDSGVMMAIENYKADDLRGQGPYWSDIMGAIAQELDVSGIHTIWRCNIKNTDTVQVMKRLLSDDDADNEVRVFELPEDDNGVVLLGTPNGVGVGALVAAHSQLFHGPMLRRVTAIATRRPDGKRRSDDETHTAAGD
ncbi:hypothetical protein GQ53DRAFT_769869 [Thozetella sp. PMI_491]|nr:hypothetical protein GQ53DRAFT_769869 [Thozetella sp. PMI_491]